jgi:hypothetical protein
VPLLSNWGIRVQKRFFDMEFSLTKEPLALPPPFFAAFPVSGRTKKSPNLELEVQYPGFLVPWGGASKVPFSGSMNSHFFMWNLYASSARISLTAFGAMAG